MSALLAATPAPADDDWMTIHSLKRSQIETLLEEEACILCHDSDTTRELAEILAAHLSEGTIPRSALVDLP